MRTTPHTRLRALAPSLGRALAWALFLSLVVAPEWYRPVWERLNDDHVDPLYHADSILHLTAAHLGLSVVATLIAAVLSVTMAVVVTRPALSGNRQVAETLIRLAQAVPPVVVLALVIPTLGFGTLPTIAALGLYGLLPIFERTVAGLEGISEAVMESARGMGMSAWQILWRIELPLARRAIVEGVRLSLTVSIGTATLGSTVAAKSLGELILAGLLSNNNAYLVQGALISGLMAMLVYDLIRTVEQHWSASGR